MSLIASLLFFIQAANALNSREYLKSFIKQSPLISEKTLQKLQEKNKEEAQSDRYELQLDVQPYYQKIRYDFPTLPVYDINSYKIDSTVTQTLPTATVLKFEGSYDYSDRTDQTVDQNKYSLALTLSQPFLKNRFGRTWKFLANSHQLEKLALEHEEKLTLIQECNKGALNYLETYFAKQNLDTYLEVLDEANKVRTIAKRNYDQRIMTRIDYLAAQSSYLEVQSKIAELKRKYLAFLGNISVIVKEEVDELLSPQEILNKNDKLRSKDFDQTLHYQILKKRIESRESYYKFVKDNNRTDLSGFVQVGTSSTKNDFSFTVQGDNNNKYVAAGVVFDIPAINPDIKRDKANAYLDKELAQNKLRQTKLDYQFKQQELTTNLSSLSEIIQLREQTNSVLDVQTKEAFNLFKKARLDFVDYLNYRNNYIQNRITYQDALFEQAKSKLSLFELQGDLPAFCGQIQ